MCMSTSSSSLVFISNSCSLYIGCSNGPPPDTTRFISSGVPFRALHYRWHASIKKKI